MLYPHFDSSFSFGYLLTHDRSVKSQQCTLDTVYGKMQNVLIKSAV